MAHSDPADNGRHGNRDDSGDCSMLDLSEGTPTRATGRPLAPPEVSNQSIGSGRRLCSRSRHRHHRRRSRLRFKRKESNFFAAIASMVVLVLMCTALAEPQWFYLRGGGCKDSKDKEISYIGINQFFYMGKFLHPQEHQDQTVYKFGPKSEEIMFNCVTVQIVSIMKSIISLSLFGIALTLAAFLLDLSGPTHRMLKIVRRYGILNILTVGFCVVINGFCYWATEDLALFQKTTKPITQSKVEIEFSVSFFLITAAGSISVIAAACNLLRRHGSSSSSSSSSSREQENEQDRENLLDDFDGSEFNPLDMSFSSTCLPPPPPYSP